MSVPAFTLEDIDSDLRRLRLARGSFSALFRCVEEEGRHLAPVLSIIDAEGWLAARIEQIGHQLAEARGIQPAGLSQLLAVIGPTDIGRLALIGLLQRSFVGPERAYGWSESDHWSHAIFSACVAEAVAGELGASRGRAFAAGLTHGLGRYFLGWHCGRWGVRMENPGPISSAQLREEATRFGMNQCDAAGAVLQRLGADDSLHVAVRWFWYPQFAGEFTPDCERLHAAVELALAVRSQAEGTHGPWEHLHPAQRRVLSLALPRVRLMRLALGVGQSGTTRPPMAVGV